MVKFWAIKGEELKKNMAEYTKRSPAVEECQE